MEDFFESLCFPASTYVGRKLDKKEFLDNFSLNINERKLLSQAIDRITLENILNKDTINITPYLDVEKDYSEIAVIKVKISNKEKLKSINNIIQQIPYSLIVFYIFENELNLCLSPKRINKANSSKLLVEEVHFSKWIDFSNLTDIDKTFLQSLNINNHPFTNFLAFYESFIDKLVSFNASKYIGILSSSKDTKEILEEIQNLEANIIEIKNKIKKETNFNNKVNMNIELKKLNDKLNITKEQLCKN
ncbi:DUF4391 domain-containing protein [Arcobacter cryaerophilus gv. pseudocryaerophilus]|uniref:DUF4391 domain-containing protein n=3 Tax=Arcobacteraceae TaxID=2808963 RepID=A0AA96DTE0_9BACT|nr:DUF4391 domain-containing protein [Arcobacter sp. AZ-2023]WNL36726.1 DUF4391 domain-containing protein [Arcobacter sp. AZ-2023]WPD12442.1 DUF4391 domain-containing protein [Arcobacter sp. DSM 115960]